MWTYTIVEQWTMTTESESLVDSWVGWKKNVTRCLFARVFPAGENVRERDTCTHEIIFSFEWRFFFSFFFLFKLRKNWAEIFFCMHFEISLLVYSFYCSIEDLEIFIILKYLKWSRCVKFFSSSKLRRIRDLITTIKVEI